MTRILKLCYSKTPLTMVVVALLLASACSGGSDQTTMERELQEMVSNDLAPVRIGAVSNPAMILRRVDFPEPLIPSTPILSPFLTVKERLLNNGLLGQAIARDSMSRRVI